MRKNIFISLASLVMLFMASSCENRDWEFEDYDYQTVYFAYQSPVRTIVLGEYIYDNSLDNQHQFQIMATMGGVYQNKANRVVSFKTDNSLCDNLKIEDENGAQVMAMPSNYYTLADSKITIPSGSVKGGVNVQLTDAFFADEKAIQRTYAIPLVMTSVEGADSILSGVPKFDGADKRITGEWDVEPKDYTIFMVKYINKYHGAYLRRGVQTSTGNGDNSLDTTISYHAKYVEKDLVANMYTKSLSSTSLPLSAMNVGGVTTDYNALLTFSDNGECQVSAADTAAAYTISGTGKYVVDGDMWGNEPRDVLYLNYSVDFGTVTHSFVDTMVVRTRGVVMETFGMYVAP